VALIILKNLEIDMRHQDYISVWILATGLPTLEEADTAIHGFFGGTPRPVDGCYKGTTEQSHLVTGSTKEQVIEFLKEFNQESALLVDNQRNGWLVFSDGGDDAFIGAWKKVSEAEALREDGYTKIDGQYYICK
jgi:hypothetical protein